jgi:virginiamycin B lyase
MGLVRRGCILVLVASLVVAAVGAAPAVAALPTIYELPAATHARAVAVAPDGTVWFVPERGTESEGDADSILVSVNSGGAVEEHEVAGIESIQSVAISPAGQIWIAGYEGSYTARRLREVGRVSDSGSLEVLYPAGVGGWIRSLVAGEKGAWFVLEPYAARGPSTIEGISDAGAVQHLPTPNCRPVRIAVGADGARWFTEMCATKKRAPRAFLAEIRQGRVKRRPLGTAERPTSLKIAPDGTVWFGLTHKFAGEGYGYPKVGRVTRSGDVAEFRLGDGSTYYPATIGPEGRFWFQSWIPGHPHEPALNSIGVDGSLGKPICADPTCTLEATGLATAPDGSLWYGLRGQNLNTGGGGAGLGIEMEIANQAGFIGNLDL